MAKRTGPSSPKRLSYRAYAYDRRLSPEYKDRLRYQGIGREEYVRGGYNVKSPPPLTRERREGALERIATGRERPEDMGIARRWYASKYVPAELRNQPGLNKVATAAALFQVADWGQVRSVSFTPSTDPIWEMTVTLRNGQKNTFDVPYYVVEDIRTWLDGSDIENDIGGSI